MDTKTVVLSFIADSGSVISPHQVYIDHLSPDNALDVVEMIEGLLRNHSTLSYQELVTVLNKLEDIVDLSVVTPDLGQALINIISDILESDSNLQPFTNT